MDSKYTNEDFFYTDPKQYDDRSDRDALEKYSIELWEPILLSEVKEAIFPGAIVSDLGCGTFVHTPYMGNAARIYAVDINQAMLDYGKPKLDAIKEKVTVLCEDCAHTSIPDHSCDVVWIDGLSEFMNLEDLFKEIDRVTKKEASFHILFHNAIHPFHLPLLLFYKLTGKKKTMRSVFQMKSMAKKYGFLPTQTISTGIYFYTPKLTQRFFLPLWKFLNWLYEPLQKYFPLGNNILCSFKKN